MFLSRLECQKPPLHSSSSLHGPQEAQGSFHCLQPPRPPALRTGCPRAKPLRQDPRGVGGAREEGEAEMETSSLTASQPAGGLFIRLRAGTSGPAKGSTFQVHANIWGGGNIWAWPTVTERSTEKGTGRHGLSSVCSPRDIWTLIFIRRKSGLSAGTTDGRIKINLFYNYFIQSR